MAQRNIVAMGGGGFSMEPENPLLDRYVLGLVNGSDRPRIGFLPQASAESRDYVTRFYAAMVALGAEPSWLSLWGRVKGDYLDWIAAQDVIYVGGGNTRSMLAVWREWGVDKALRQAYEAGTVLCGVSAGMICWFAEGVTDSVWPLGSLPCLGFVEEAGCPHYDGEADRRPALHRFVADGTIRAASTIALDDSAAAHYVDGKLARIVSSVPTAKGYRVTRDATTGKAVEEELPTTYLGA